MKKTRQISKARILSRNELKQILGGLEQQSSTCTIQCAGSAPISYTTTGSCSIESRTVQISSTTEQVQVGIIENGQIIVGCTVDQPVTYLV